MTQIANAVLLFAALLLYYGLFPMTFVLAQRSRPTGLVVLGALGLLPLAGLVAHLPALSLYLGLFLGPGLVLAWGARHRASAGRLFIWAQVPALAAAGALLMQPGFSGSIQEALALGAGLPAESPSEAGAAGRGPLLMIEKLWPAILVAEVGFRLVLGMMMLAWVRFRRETVAFRLEPVSRMRFEDWPVWVLIGALAAAVLGLYTSRDLAWWAAGVICLLSPFYFARGVSVAAARFLAWKSDREGDGPSPVWTFFWWLLLFVFAPYLALALMVLGVADTWWDFREKSGSIKQERTTVWK